MASTGRTHPSSARTVGLLSLLLAAVTGLGSVGGLVRAASARLLAIPAPRYAEVAASGWPTLKTAGPLPDAAVLHPFVAHPDGQARAAVGPHVAAAGPLSGRAVTEPTVAAVVPTAAGPSPAPAEVPAFAPPAAASGTWTLTSAAAQIRALGKDQATSPPDPQIAVGPQDVLEMVNASAAVYAKTGALRARVDLNVFFPVPAGWTFTDPRVQYDPLSGRWFATGFAYDRRADSEVYVAVSAAGDPAGRWTVWTVGRTAGLLADQPKFAVSRDKLAVSWNDFQGGTGQYVGEETWILDKAGLLAGAAAVPAAELFGGPDPDRYGLVPATVLSPTATLWLVYNNADPALDQNTTGPTLGVVAVTGDPAAHTVAVREYDPPILPMTAPPAADQPGAPGSVETGDDRLLSAVWADGRLWAVGNDGCVPPGSRSPRACLRLLEVRTTGAAPAVRRDFDLAEPAADLYYPAVTADARGDLLVAFSWSSATQYPSAAVAVAPAAGPPGAFGPVLTVAPGRGRYGLPGPDPTRFGDYSGAAPDPARPDTLWGVAEYAASASRPLDWGTAAAAVTLPGPTAAP
ncbi:MAG: hypothetical protein K6V97_08990 [Actinomycetia bacterium]|nr:hypothetical protein [Actinomycetes bacterium]